MLRPTFSVMSDDLATVMQTDFLNEGEDTHSTDLDIFRRLGTSKVEGLPHFNDGFDEI